MNGQDNQDRSKWEDEMYTKLYEQKSENKRLEKINKMLSQTAYVIIIAVYVVGIIGIFLMNRSNGYLF